MKIIRSAYLRGLRDIRTRSGRVDRAGVPYLAYMRISCIEMERARREKEKQSAAARIKNIEERVAEIEIEKAALLTALGERGTEAPAGTDRAKASTKVPRKDESAFKIKY